LRGRLGELDKSKPTVVFCAIGVRAYNGARILQQNGFGTVSVYPGGSRFYQTTHFKEENTVPYTQNAPVSDSGHADTRNVPVSSMRLDCSGMQCPGPIMKVFETMKEMKDGDVMEVSASDPGFARDIVAWTRRTGNTLLSNERRGGDYVALVKKGLAGGAPAAVAQANGDGKTIIVFSGDLDKVLASFIIANGAAAMGRKVTMFFTFWGLNVLRKNNRQKVDKSFIEAMFGGMMPRGVNKLKLSKMNMMGMGTSMMKMIMKKKNVDSLETLMKKAMAAGVKIIACTMSMDVMGIKEQELIDGIELGGVGAYLGDAEESNVNLFI
ncbi:MAG TPA: DsrE/DsrF/DrsH-like family protein, partial [Clostridia bacterium]|nr:DsrE/DsrF/DrsH-like family protein [Clostridia bacterium]